MTKTFCDKCKQEAEIRKVQVHTQVGKDYMMLEFTRDLCEDCKQLFVDFARLWVDA